MARRQTRKMRCAWRKSGINMSMSDEYYLEVYTWVIKSGEVTMEKLDDAARHVLNVKYDMGLFNDPYSHLAERV
ncbi:hypothetical protein ACLK1T_23300 [Escherichia coli]